MSIVRIFVIIIGAILAVVGLLFTIQHLGLNWDVLTGLIVMLVMLVVEFILLQVKQ